MNTENIAGIDNLAPALKGASNYVEHLKLDNGSDDERIVDDPTREQIIAAFNKLLGEAGVADAIKAEELLDGIRDLSVPYTFLMGLPPLIARTIFADGLMHGIALAGKLTAEEPQV